jgi:predicted negative regulator of RcsB-dependent stress response
VEIYNSDDQVANLKNWWRQYGKSLITGVVIGIIVLAGLNYWRQYRNQQGEAASILYDSLLADLQQGKRDNALTTAAKLMQESGSTPYAGKAALTVARLHFDSNDLAAARQALEWAVANASETAVQHSARLRLGRLMLDQKETDAVLKLLDVHDTQGFESEYAELRGDVMLARGDQRAAREAYQQALDKLSAGSGYAKWLTMKRDSLGAEAKP